MTWKLGILIVGSLYWDCKRHRVKWRKKRLNLDRETLVRVPICYGRRSDGRGGTYTMVFAPGCELGQAIVVECQRSVSSFKDVVEEAKALWIAEQRQPTQPAADRMLSSDWGCVALLVNPKSAPLPPDLLRRWKECVSRQLANGKLAYDSKRYKVGCESAINDDGLLQIGWPVRADDDQPLDSLDLLLATATVPTPCTKTCDLPAVEVITQAWKDSPKEADYFWSNQNHRIYTFQDEEIKRLLEPASGSTGPG